VSGLELRMNATQEIGLRGFRQGDPLSYNARAPCDRLPAVGETEDAFA
jgi:hypothetical protein